MWTPINYAGMAGAPMQGMEVYVQLGQQIRQARDKRAQQEQAQVQARAAAEQMQADLGAFTAAPTAQGALALGVKYPDRAKAVQDLYGSFSAERQQNEMRDMGALAAALGNGRPDVAVSLIDSRIASMKNAGQPTASMEQLRVAVEQDPQAARARLTEFLAYLPGGDKVLENIGKRGTEQRAADKAPIDLRTAEAGAQTAEAAAAVAPQVQAATRDRAVADAATAQVGAKYAEPMKVAEIQQAAAQLGLTKAQTTQAIVTTRKLSADIQRAALEAQTGDPAKRFDLETKVRGEFVKNTGDARAVQDAFARINASQDSGVGDISLIFGYMKMLDPQSVVREGEFATAQNSGGVDDKVQNVYNKLLNGERLTPKQRASFLSQARDLNGVAEGRIATERKKLDPVVKSYRLDERNIFGGDPATSPAPSPAPAPGAPPVVRSDADYAKLPSGSLFVDPEGKTRRKP